MRVVGSRLEELTPGASVGGLISGQVVTVVAVEWHGPTCVTLTYRTTDGRSDHQLVYRADGFPDDVTRIVDENATTLRFTDHGFEST